MYVAAALALSTLIGLSLGLLGGGGSTLAVPVLVYVAGVEPHQAAAMSLAIVGVTSLIGGLAHARAGRVEVRVMIRSISQSKAMLNALAAPAIK